MKIKRIEICGFKSFVDKTSISFPDPITSIVGPNGCGKSNVVDAIRWVMGEQSAKHLRGRAMEDVIFSGSESRGPAGMAEVSLMFDARGLAHDANNNCGIAEYSNQPTVSDPYSGLASNIPANTCKSYPHERREQ